MSPRPQPIIIPGPSGFGSNFQQEQSEVNLSGLIQLLDATIGKSMREKKARTSAEAIARLINPGKEAVPGGIAGGGPQSFGTELPEGGGTPMVNLPDQPAQDSPLLPLAQTEQGRKTLFDMLKSSQSGDTELFSAPKMYQVKEGENKGEYRWGLYNKQGDMAVDLRKATKKEIEGAAAVNINMGKPAAASEREKLASGAAALDSLANLKALYDKSFVGPVAGRTGKFKNVFGMNPEKQSEFLAATAAFRNAIIKEITGAQMSEPEAKRILKQVPDETDPPTVWNAKHAQSVKNIKMLQKRRKQVLRESGLKVPEMGGGEATKEKKPLSSFEGR